MNVRSAIFMNLLPRHSSVIASALLLIALSSEIRADIEIKPENPLFTRIWALPEGKVALTFVVLILKTPQSEKIDHVPSLQLREGGRHLLVSRLPNATGEKKEVLMNLVIYYNLQDAHIIRSEFQQAENRVYEVFMDRSLVSKATLNWYSPKRYSISGEDYFCLLKNYAHRRP